MSRWENLDSCQLHGLTHETYSWEMSRKNLPCKSFTKSFLRKLSHSIRCSNSWIVYMCYCACMCMSVYMHVSRVSQWMGDSWRTESTPSLVQKAGRRKGGAARLTALHAPLSVSQEIKDPLLSTVRAKGPSSRCMSVMPLVGGNVSIDFMLEIFEESVFIFDPFMIEYCDPAAIVWSGFGIYFIYLITTKSKWFSQTLSVLEKSDILVPLSRTAKARIIVWIQFCHNCALS